MHGSENAIAETIAAIQRLDAVMDDNKRVMTCGEAAYVLGVSNQTVSRYISEGKLHKASAHGVNGVWAREVYAILR